MKIEVLGTGCTRCNQLYENVIKALSDIDLKDPINVKKIENIQEIVNAGVFTTPGLVIDGTVISTGKVPSASMIREEIQERIK